MAKSEKLQGAPASGHYKGYPIEPLEYIEANGLPFHEGNIVKYVTRWREKGGVEDLEKAVFYLERLILLARHAEIPHDETQP